MLSPDTNAYNDAFSGDSILPDLFSFPIQDMPPLGSVYTKARRTARSSQPWDSTSQRSTFCLLPDSRMLGTQPPFREQTPHLWVNRVLMPDCWMLPVLSVLPSTISTLPCPRNHSSKSLRLFLLPPPAISILPLISSSAPSNPFRTRPSHSRGRFSDTSTSAALLKQGTLCSKVYSGFWWMENPNFHPWRS